MKDTELIITYGINNVYRTFGKWRPNCEDVMVCRQYRMLILDCLAIDDLANDDKILILICSGCDKTYTDVIYGVYCTYISLPTYSNNPSYLKQRSTDLGRWHNYSTSIASDVVVQSKFSELFFDNIMNAF